MAASSKHTILWSQTNPTQLHLVSADSINSWPLLKACVGKRLTLNPKTYDLATLDRGSVHTLSKHRYEVDTVPRIVLCLPASDLSLRIQTEEGRCFNVPVNVLQNVCDLKTMICQYKGLPVEQQELLFKNRALINKSKLLDHDIKHDSKIHLKIQPARAFGIQVQTFWGATFQTEVTPELSPKGLLRRVMRRERLDTMEAGTAISLMLVMYNGRILSDGLCLNYYGIKQGSVLQVVAMSDVAKRPQQMIEAWFRQTDASVKVSAADSDLWLLVALKLQGMTGTPVSAITLMTESTEIDLSSSVSDLKTASGERRIQVINSRCKRQASALSNHKMQIELLLPSGVSHVLECSRRTTIREVKDMMAERDVDNVHNYDAVYNKAILPNASSLQTLKLPNKSRVVLKLREFCVTILHGNSSTEISVHPSQTLSSLLHKATSYCGHSKMIYCGKELSSEPNKRMTDMELCDGATIFTDTSTANALHLVTESAVIPVSYHSMIGPLHKQQLNSLEVDISHLEESLQQFMAWKYPDHRRVRLAANRLLHKAKGRSLGLSIPSRETSQLYSDPSSKGQKNSVKLEQLPIPLQERPSSRINSAKQEDIASISRPFSRKAPTTGLERSRSDFINLPGLTDPAVEKTSTSNPSEGPPKIKSAISGRMASSARGRNLSVRFHLPREELSSGDRVKVWTVRGLHRASVSQKPLTAAPSQAYRLSPLQYSALKTEYPLQFSHQRLPSRESSSWRGRTIRSAVADQGQMLKLNSIY